jgi:hypothetical protein
LLAGGSGVDLDSGLPLSWEVDSDGALVVTFADRWAQMTPVRVESAGIMDTVTTLFGAFGADGAVSHAAFVVKTDAVVGWPAVGEVSGTYLLHAGRSSEEFSTVLDADRSGRVGSVPFHWSRPTDDELVLRSCRPSASSYVAVLDREPEPGECNHSYRRISWRTMARRDDTWFVREMDHRALQGDVSNMTRMTDRISAYSYTP